MIQVLVSVLMWLLVASLLILRRDRTDHSITYSAVTIAVAMTLNIDAVYTWVDPMLGGTNIVTLLADLALMIGIFFLGRGVAKASEYTPRVIKVTLGRTVLTAALVGAVVSFALIDRGATTTTFMLDYGAQPAAGAYSIVQYAYDGAIMTTMAVVAAGQIGRSTGAARLPAVSLLLGSLIGLTLAIVIIVMDIAHVTGNLTLMSTLGVAYGPLFLLTFLFLCSGLAGQPAIGWARARSRMANTSALVARVNPIWQRASAVRPGMSQQLGGGFRGEDAEAQLHRQVVEIRDAVIDPRVTFELSASERELLEEAEAHLMGRNVSPRAVIAQPKEAH
ncbi:hypothetical protein [Microbacterium sp. P5_E9]